MKKNRRLLQSDTFWGLTAALLVILQFWWLPGEDGSASDSYSTTIDGKLGLFRTLSQLFPKVERDALSVVPAEPSCLVLIAPDRYPNDQEQSQLYEFVYSGGTLVFAPNWDDPNCDMRALGITTIERSWTDTTTATATTTLAIPPPPTIPAQPTVPAEMPAEVIETETSTAGGQMLEQPDSGELSETPPSDDSEIDGSSESPLSAREELLSKKTPGLTPGPGLDSTPEDLGNLATPGETVTVSSELLDGSVEWQSSAELNVPTYIETETLVTSNSGDVEAATWPMGNGRIIVCSSADIFSNRSMLYSDSRRLAVRLVERGYLHGHSSAGESVPIVLSEYFNASDSYQQTGVLLSPSLRIGTLQLVLVAVLGIWLAFYRFGPAEGISTLQRRSLTESAQAVGNLQYRLNDGGAVIRGYLEYIRSQLRRHYGSFVRLDQPESIANRAGMDVNEVRMRLAEAHVLAETPGLSAEKTASSLRWLAALQRCLSGNRNEKST